MVNTALDALGLDAGRFEMAPDLCSKFRSILVRPLVLVYERVRVVKVVDVVVPDGRLAVDVDLDDARAMDLACFEMAREDCERAECPSDREACLRVTGLSELYTAPMMAFGRGWRARISRPTCLRFSRTGSRFSLKSRPTPACPTKYDGCSWATSVV
jgi:hypothetical protein